MHQFARLHRLARRERGTHHELVAWLGRDREAQRTVSLPRVLTLREVRKTPVAQPRRLDLGGIGVQLIQGAEARHGTPNC